MCREWEKGEKRVSGCKYRDLIMPAVWGLWKEAVVGREWLRCRLGVKVGDEQEALVAAARVE